MYLKRYILNGVMLFLAFLMMHEVQGQAQINQFDAEGRRHGPWEKYYEGTQQLRYTGTFNHGVEVGVFKYYCASCGDQAVVIRHFDSIPGSCAVTYYTNQGQIVAQGHMQDQKRVGLWTTYHKGGHSVMSKEYYKDDLLQGTKETYYPDDTLAETCTYTKGERQGVCRYFGPGGQLIKSFTYEDDQLHGPAEFFDLSGTLERSGFYDRDRKSGVWKTFVDGKVVKQEHFNPNVQ